MNGDFNVGVAKLQVLGPATEAAEDEARTIPITLFRRLESASVLGCGAAEEGELGTGGRPFECQGPETVGLLAGDDAERTAKATEYSGRTDANLVVYGTVAETDGIVTFNPEIYISKETMNRAEELAGPHALTPRTYEARSDTQKRRFRGEVEQLAADLGTLSTALSFYSDPDYGKALEAVNELLEAGTFELDASLLHLIAGNLLGKLAVAAEGPVDRLARVTAAEQAYQASIDATPGYARGWLGLGEIAYQRGRGNAECAAGSVDSTELDTSIERYESAIGQPVSPPEANIDVKASFGVGRNRTCLAQAGIGNQWAEARRSFEFVTNEYETGTEGITEYASESYSLLAHIGLELATADERAAALERSIELNKKAIETNTDPDRIGVFSYLIARAYLELGLGDLACDPLQRALDVSHTGAVADQPLYDCG
jgi:tetratricopeptide (TPR) repeat protein